jgi:hypothetical protein
MGIQVVITLICNESGGVGWEMWVMLLAAGGCISDWVRGFGDVVGTRQS